MTTSKTKHSWTRELLAGGGAGMIGIGVGYPFDTIKVYQQVNSISFTQSSYWIHKKHGFLGFFRGMTVPILSNGLVFATFFSTYNTSLVYFTAADGRYHHDHLHRSVEDLATFSEIFLAGCVGGVTQSFLAGPIELVKIQMQLASRDKLPDSRATIKKIIHCRGARGFGIGLGATLIRDVHAHGVYTLVYREYLNFFHPLKHPTDEPSSFALFMAGGTAGMLYWWSCIPMDVVKSRLQGDSLTQPKYKNSWDCTRQIYRQFGVKPFLRGFGSTTIRAFPANGCIFLAYEKLRDLYEWGTSL